MSADFTNLIRALVAAQVAVFELADSDCSEPADFKELDECVKEIAKRTKELKKFVQT